MLQLDLVSISDLKKMKKQKKMMEMKMMMMDEKTVVGVIWSEGNETSSEPGSVALPRVALISFAQAS